MFGDGSASLDALGLGEALTASFIAATMPEILSSLH